MATRRWPDPPTPPSRDCFGGTDIPGPPLRDQGRMGQSGEDMYGWGTANPNPTLCKHGVGSCEECGTTNRRDSAHTTKGGRGAVGRLRR